jgi:MFS family permease
MLVALGVDNFGSGLFLPLALVYVTRAVGLPLGTAGALVSLGTLLGLIAPAIAGRLVDRLGPKPVIIAAQLLQALGAFAYLLAHSAPVVLLAAAFLAAGQQTFYSSLYALISDVAGSGPRERPFAIAGMVRSACFGFGGLVVAGVLTAAGPVALRIAVAADAASFIACSLLLALFVRLPPRVPSCLPGRSLRRRPGRLLHRPEGALPGRQADRHAAREAARRQVLTDVPFLALIATTGLAVIAVDFFLAGTPVYILELLHARPWLPGTILAVETALTSTSGTLVLHATSRLGRLRAMQLGAALYALWCLATLAALVVPTALVPAELLLTTVILAAANLVFGPRAAALAEAAAPPEVRGRYLAAFQYAFTVAGVVAPAVVALFTVAVWLPWALVASTAGAAVVGLGVLAGHLPAAALSPENVGDPGAEIRAA